MNHNTYVRKFNPSLIVEGRITLCAPITPPLRHVKWLLQLSNIEEAVWITTPLSDQMLTETTADIRKPLLRVNQQTTVILTMRADIPTSFKFLSIHWVLFVLGFFCQSLGNICRFQQNSLTLFIYFSVNSWQWCTFLICSICNTQTLYCTWNLSTLIAGPRPGELTWY